MRDGKSIDTTMGFSTLDGLMMGTRCGTLDPGVVLQLQTQLGMGADEVDDLLYRKSGLLGVSGISSDMTVLPADPNRQAQEAGELLVWRAVREVGAPAAFAGAVVGTNSQP